MIDKLQAHYGFTRMPFGRDLAPGMLHRHAAHNEAVARITWCVAERAIGIITGEVGAGKTVSVRTVLAGLDASRHAIIYLPNPMIGVRGIHETIVAAFGGAPDRSSSRLPPRPPPSWAPNATSAPHPRPGHRRSPPAPLRATREHPDAHQPQPRPTPPSPSSSSASPPSGAP